MTRSGRLAILFTLVLSPLGAFGQEAPPTPSPSPVASPAATPAPPVKTAVDFTLGLGYHGPTHLTGSATLMWGKARMFGALAPGKLIQVRGGARGGQIGVGFAAGAFEDSAFRPSGVGATFKVIALRAWRDPAKALNGNTYVGLESDVILLGFRGSLGYAWKAGGSGAPGGRFVWSLGLGL